MCRGSGKTTLYFTLYFAGASGGSNFSPGFCRLLHQCKGTFQNQLQVALRLQASFLGCFNKTVKDCAVLGTVRYIAEQKILPTHYEMPYAGLGAVVGELQPSTLSNILLA